MVGYLWKATVRNVNRALKEINAFDGVYRHFLARGVPLFKGAGDITVTPWSKADRSISRLSRH